MRFHRRCGDRVTLLHGNSTAVRNFAEFNHGLIFSAEPLKDDVIFEVSIDRKVTVWNGSLEIGVTTHDPEYMELPATATKIRNTAWILSGNSVVKDGVTLTSQYCPELNSLPEANSVGVMRSIKGELMFYINGRSLGIAAVDLPPRLFAVIDLYGQCVQVSIRQPVGENPQIEQTMDLACALIADSATPGRPLDANPGDGSAPSPPLSPLPSPDWEPRIETTESSPAPHDKLRFHPRCGILVKLTSDCKSAERTRPLDDYNNGVVLTHRPINDNELFEIRIDKLVDKWSGSIEMGVTHHCPTTIRYPSTMTNMDTGTIMMSGCKVLLNGNGTCTEYGNVNLDELKEGDTVGVLRKRQGHLHYYINGVDQGLAAEGVHGPVWGVVDLYGMTVKVTIIDPGEHIADSIANSQATTSRVDQPGPSSGHFPPRIDEDSLLFHTLRDSHVIVIDNGKTAHRPNAFEYFHNGVVTTSRTLRTNELFQVRIDLIVPKWTGSIEIGVTQHASNDLKFPYRMSTNHVSGTWILTGEDVMRDGNVIIPQYVKHLNKLKEGDTVGVMRKDQGILHFFVNGVDQGPAAFNIPQHVFGLVDLYGKIAQVSMVDTITHVVPPIQFSPESPNSSGSNATVYPDMCFHRVHGRNARLSRTRLTASRAAIYSEFNDAVLFSSRPLRECDMFELRIDAMVDCWIGSIEIGVTAIRPDDLEAQGGLGYLAGTATDLSFDTYVLSGAAMMKDGECVKSGYPLDLDTLSVGSRVGMMWHADRSLHYYLDGMDMGKAWHVPHLNIYAVIDLYGQCTQVTILQNEERTFNYNGCPNSDNSLLAHARALTTPPAPYWSFSEYCGQNVTLSLEYTCARRTNTADPNGGLVFSSSHLAFGEVFEIKIAEVGTGYAGQLRLGVTDVNILNAHVNRNMPPNISFLPHYTAYIDNRYMIHSKPGIVDPDLRSVVPSFEWLRVGDRLGLKKVTDNKILIIYNGEVLDTCFENVPDRVYAVIELFGRTTKIQAVPRALLTLSRLQPTIPNAEYQASRFNLENQTRQILNMYSMRGEERLDQVGVHVPPEESGDFHTSSLATLTGFHDVTVHLMLPFTFHKVHGSNIKLLGSETTARRVESFDNGLAIISFPLIRGRSFQFRIDKVDSQWSGHISVGAVGKLPEEPLPPTALDLPKPAWVLTKFVVASGDNEIFLSDNGGDFENVTVNSVITVTFRNDSVFTCQVDGGMVDVVATIPKSQSKIFPFIDIYGNVLQVSSLLYPKEFPEVKSINLPILSRRKEHLGDAFAKLNSFDSIQSEPKDFQLIDKQFSQDDSALSCPHLVSSSPRMLQPRRKGPLASRGLKSIHHSLIFAKDEHRGQHVLKSASLQNLAVGESSSHKPLADQDSNANYPADYAPLHHERCVYHSNMQRDTPDINQLESDIVRALSLGLNYPDLDDKQPPSNMDTEIVLPKSVTTNHISYLQIILSVNVEGEEGSSLDAEWGADGTVCANLQSVRKYWKCLCRPFPDLRRAVSWGTVRCHCSNCDTDQPSTSSSLAGWVRIERIDGVGSTTKGFWHITREIMETANTYIPVENPIRRPENLTMAPNMATQVVDIWIDDEGSPYLATTCLEIDIEGSEPARDRLLAVLLYVRPYTASE